MYVLQKYKGHSDNVHKIIYFDGYLYSYAHNAVTNIIIKWNIKTKTSGLIDRKIVCYDDYIIYITIGKFHNEIDNHLYSAYINGDIMKYVKRNKSFIKSKNSSRLITFIEGYLYSGGYNGVITKYDSNRTIICKFLGHVSHINSIIYINGYIYSASSDYYVIKWSLSGEIISRIKFSDIPHNFAFINGYLYIECSEGVCKLNINTLEYETRKYNIRFDNYITINNSTYIINRNNILKCGEFYLQDYYRLPNKKKRLIWTMAKILYRLKRININITKDIRLLIYRQLLTKVEEPFQGWN
jgi:hypothetical protein